MTTAKAKGHDIFPEKREGTPTTATMPSLPKKEDAEKQQNRQKREKWKNDFASYTTLHGVPHWLNYQYSSRVRRIAYFILWFMFFCSMVANLYGNISEYLKYETKVSMKLELNDTVRFPSVTICPENIWKKSKVGGSPIFHDQMKKFYWSLDGKSFNYCHDPTVPDLFPNLTYFRSYMSGTSDQQLVKESGLGVEDLFLSCEFQREKSNCSQLWITHVSEVLLCMTFNYANPVKTTKGSSLWFDSAYKTKVHSFV